MRNLHDYIHFNYQGKWVVKFEYKTTKSPEKNYGTGTTIFWLTFDTGVLAIQGFEDYCKKEAIEYKPISEEWMKYYANADAFVAHMMAKKDSVDKSEWERAFSMDAPNKPGYYRANND